MPYSGGNELFIIDITYDEVKSFIDDIGDIRFDIVLEWTLSKFGENNEISLFEWQAARMQNYMIYIIENKGYNPRR